MTERIAVETVETDLGPMVVASSSRGVVAVVAGRDEAALVAGIRRRVPGAEIVAAASPHAPWLVGWAAAARRDPPPLDLRGLTPFDADVYRFVAGLAWGERATYGDVAVAVGRPGAARAVGGAMGRCPLFPAVPCHRVVRAVDGWSGWGGSDDLKRRLLEREG
ncbi:MAG TPA: methylated-DNA--[protein]-cysteine S-methyltransferase [Candidatus Limnocylindria bacterium]|nr:methylated-DNA--[protein]-cysteine S-methyltransferase [Candidatus Limnocylindria bacterium]